MNLKLHVPESRDLKPRLTVFGVGGAGGNAVNNMIARALEGVDFVVANTDAQSLEVSTAKGKIQLGEELTEGLGAGAKPEVGARAAEESLDKITDHLMGSHMCFITAGMGGGTGTGAAPVIAQAARQMGILTVGVVTKPFQFEGRRRMQQAQSGIEELQQYVDTLIVIPNQNLFRIANENTTFTEAFGMADDVLYQGVKGVTDLMVRPGLVNLDFADIRSVMDEMGKAMMGTGEADGEERAILAAERAIANPLLDEISLQGARGVLINITGGDDLTLHEVDEASNKISNEVDPNANIIFGSTYDPEMTGRIRVSVVATGIDVEEGQAQRPRQTTRTHVEAAPVSSTPVEQPMQAESADLFGGERAEDSHVEDHKSDEYHAEYEQKQEPVQDALFDSPPTMTEDLAVDNSPNEPESKRYVIDAEPQLPMMDTVQPELPQEKEEDAEARKASFRARVQAATRAEPVSAPPAPKAEERSSRLAMPSLIRKISRGDDAADETPLAHRADDDNVERLAARRAAHESVPATPSLTQEEHQRVDIPAFLRRKAN